MKKSKRRHDNAGNAWYQYLGLPECFYLRQSICIFTEYAIYRKPWKPYQLNSTYSLRPNTGFRHHSPAQFAFKQGETDIGDKGKINKGKKEQQKKAQLNPKEKRKLKKEKKK